MNQAEILVPDGTCDASNPRKQFDLVTPGNDGVLRVFFVLKTNSDDQYSVSRVCSLHWGENHLAGSFQIRDHKMAEIADSLGHICILARQDSHSSECDALSESIFIFYLDENRNAIQRYEFPAEIKGFALQVTPKGSLLLDGVREDERDAGEAIASVTGTLW